MKKGTKKCTEPTVWRVNNVDADEVAFILTQLDGVGAYSFEMELSRDCEVTFKQGLAGRTGHYLKVQVVAVCDKKIEFAYYEGSMVGSKKVTYLEIVEAIKEVARGQIDEAYEKD